MGWKLTSIPLHVRAHCLAKAMADGESREESSRHHAEAVCRTTLSSDCWGRPLLISR